MGSCLEAASTLAATSCRNAVLNAAASSKVSGGTSRVFVRPGAEAFAITAMPQEGGLGALPEHLRFILPSPSQWMDLQGPSLSRHKANLRRCAPWSRLP